MSRTVTALYDTRTEAEAARQHLSSALPVGSARIIDRPGELDGLHMSADDRRFYQEGLRRGAFVLTAEVRGHEDADKIIRILEDTASVDTDAREEQWRREGWSSPASSGSAAAPGLRLPRGSRESGRGGGRARSYVREDSFDDRREEQRSAVDYHSADHHYSPQAYAPERTAAGRGVSRPSDAVVIGSAITGAVIGGVVGGLLPFLLADTAPDPDRRHRSAGRTDHDHQRGIALSGDGHVRMFR